jgi:hypothetical protein
VRCRYCGRVRPFRWMGGFHCREDGFHPKRTRPVDWEQGERRGRWPADWPEEVREQA